MKIDFATFRLGTNGTTHLLDQKRPVDFAQINETFKFIYALFAVRLQRV